MNLRLFVERQRHAYLRDWNSVEQLGSAKVLTLNGSDNLSTSFNGTTLSESFIDSGSNGLFFDDSITLCSGGSGFYCPTSPISLSAVMEGINGNNVSLNFSVANADTMVSAGEYAMNDFAAKAAGMFDWGLPFFYGRTIFYRN